MRIQSVERKSICIALLALAGAARGFSQEPTPSPTATPPPPPYSEKTLTELKQLQQAALKSDYAWRQTAHLSNNIGPRLTGSAQAEKAVEYVAAELKALGLEVRLEKVTVPRWVRGEETAALVEFPGMAPNTTQKIILTALGASVATPATGLTAEVAVVRNFDELRALGTDKIKGKIVVFDYHYDKLMASQGRGGEAYGQAVKYRSDGPSAAARLGAVAAIIRSVGSAEYRLPHTGQTDYAKDAPKIPAAAMTAEDADLIAALVPQGTVRMRLLLTPQTLPDAISHNVIGDLKGSEHPEQIVIVSGHLDSWDLGTGAIDDAAGVAVSMETANLMQKLKLRPKRTLRVIAWMNEENGLAGGKAYAKEHEKEIANHFAAMEIDGGAGHPLGINYAVKEAKALLEPVAKILQESGAGILNFSEHAGGADIGPLTKQGVPGFSPIQDNRTYFHYHHTAADTLDKIVPRELAENAAVVAVTAYALANLEQPIPR
ncbi:MAG TPA: M20/M25/M40 family metallo-hydrolase [Chthoniobacterales bacterium]|nr:M20/M25/M40 family metallo-hydrolase [Chthoniobacterales bacterium]